MILLLILFCSFFFFFLMFVMFVVIEVPSALTPMPSFLFFVSSLVVCVLFFLE